jgi:3D (Asp-Asp-Asp) domain-containing protein
MYIAIIMCIYSVIALVELRTKLVNTEDNNITLQCEVDALRIDATNMRTQNLQLEEENDNLLVAQEELRKLIKSGVWYMSEGVSTAYSPYDDQNGLNSSGDASSTSIGLKPSENVIAVDPEKIPYYSDMIIICEDGTIYRGIAGDTGGALRDTSTMRIDVFKKTFKEAIKFGRQNVTIFWRPKK